MARKGLYYSTPKGITFKQYEEILSIPQLEKLINFKPRNKRIRGLIAALVYFDMEQGTNYTVYGLVEMAKKYNPNGANAMSLTRQRVATLLGQLCRKGVLDSKKEGNKKYYYKVIK